MSEANPSQKHTSSAQSHAYLESSYEADREIDQFLSELNEEMLGVLSTLFLRLERSDEDGFCALLPAYLEMTFACVDHIAPPTFDEFDAWDDARMLSAASLLGLPRAMETLLKAGARAFSEREKSSPLALASRSQSPKAQQCLEILLAHGASVNNAGSRGESPLHVAAGAGRVDLCLFLLERGADYRRLNAKGQTPWSWAVSLSQRDAAAAIHAWAEASEIVSHLPTIAPAAPAPARRI